MKKILSLILIFTTFLTLCSCTSTARPDINTFAERMGKLDERYSFDYFDMFVYDDAYNVYLNICEPSDVMLSFKIDDGGNIDMITLSAYFTSVKTEDAKNEVQKLCFAVISCFADISEKELTELKQTLQYENTAKYFTNIYNTYSTNRNNFTFSSNKTYLCFCVEYKEEISGI